MKTKRNTTISFIIVIAILAFLFSKLDINELLNQLKNINITYYIIGLIIFYLSFYPRGLRWGLLLRNLGIKKSTKNLTEIYFLSWFANLIVPAKLGDLYRSYLFKKNYDHSKSEIMGTVFIERLVDIIFLIVFFTLSGFMIFKNKFSQDMQDMLLIAYILLIAVIVIFILVKKLRLKLTRLLPERFKHIIVNFEEAASACVKKRNLHKLIIITLVYWILESATLYFAAKSLNVELSFYLIIFVTLVSALISVIPLTPSGAGLAEAGVTGVLVLIGLEYNIAFTIAIVHRSMDYWSGLITGSVVYAKSKLK